MLVALQPLFDEGWISDVVAQVKSGKEADVFLCRGAASAGRPLLAAKVYRPRENRGFKDDSAYWDGGMRAMSRRARLAATKRTDFGREVLFGAWLQREYQTLTTLHRAGARVPAPHAMLDRVLLMEWQGDGESAAPQLRQVQLTTQEAEAALDFLLGQVRLFLLHDVVHGDLSPYNILWRHGPVVIDFPQAVDPRFNHNARGLLERDLTNVVKHFGRFGLWRDPTAIAGELWNSWLRGSLAAY